MKQLIHIISLVIFVLILTSCVQTPDPETPNRINYRFNVDDVGSTVVADQDSIEVNELKLLADKFNLEFAENGRLESQPDGIIMGYRSENNGEDELVLGVNIGFEDINEFNGLELFIAPPSDQDNIQDNDFFGGENNYAFIMRGAYNSDEFVYRSSVSFEKQFEFDRVELTDDKQLLVIRLLLDIEDIIIDEAGNILNPENNDNKAVIDSLVQTSLELEAFASDRNL